MNLYLRIHQLPLHSIGTARDQLTKNMLKTVLETDLFVDLGHKRGWTPLRPHVCNNTWMKSVLSKIGPVEIEVPRNRDRSLEPITACSVS